MSATLTRSEAPPDTATPQRSRRRTASFDTALGWRSGVNPSNVLRWVLIIIVVLSFALPFWAVMVNAFDAKPDTSAFHLLPRDFSLAAWRAAADRGVLGYLFNSLVIVGGGVLLQLATSIAASYALARHDFRGAAPVFGLFLLTMMLPEDIIAVPLSQLLGGLPPLDVSVRGTPLAVIFPVAAWGFSVMLMTEFMKDIPKEIEESARIDGAGELRVLFSIILPMSRPVIGVATIFGFIMVWDQYLLPLISANSPEDYTLTVALRIMRDDPDVGQGVLMVGAVLALVPSLIVFALLQKSLIRGIAAGAVKG